MHTTTPHTADQHAGLPSRLGQELRRRFLRKLWLPRIIYELLPYLYMTLGLLAIYAATRVPGWAWILPYAALVGLLCVHAGLGIAVLRYRSRNSRRLRRRS